MIVEVLSIFQAYHDMATHNVEDGTGGLDGSIRIPEEQDRAEVCFAIWCMIGVKMLIHLIRTPAPASQTLFVSLLEPQTDMLRVSRYA